MSAARRHWAAWAATLLATGVAMLVVRARLDQSHVALAFLLVVLGASADGGRVLGVTVAAAAFLAFNYFFIPPYHTLVIADPLDWIVLFAFLVTSVVAAQLLYRANATAAAATQRAAEVDRLAALGAETLSAPGAEEALQAIAAVIRGSTGVERCEVYRREAGGRLVRVASAVDGAGATDVDALVASPDGPVAWTARTGRSAVELLDGTVRHAADTDDAGAPMSAVGYAVREPRSATPRIVPLPAVAHAGPAVRAVLLPLRVREHTAGVLRIASDRGLALTPEQARLLAALAYYAALGVERVRLVERAERAEAERRLEALRGALLTAVSHDLRTPLTTIKGIAHEIAHGADPSRAAVIEAEADRMDVLVGDLLDLSRIHGGAVRPNVQVNTVDELLGAALQRAAGPLGARPVLVDAPADELLVGRFDLSEALRALVNLLENAAKYAPPDTPIALHVQRVDARLRIGVLDRGIGVPASEQERIFEPFYRPPGTPADVRGTGLGLSIARGLAEAQGGTVRYEPRADGGSAFVLELPAAEPPLAEPEDRHA